MIEYLTTCIDNVLRQRPSSGIVIGGDFNQLKLKELCNRFNLKRSVTKPTREQNTLDQILTNMLPLLKMLDDSLPENTIRVHHSDKPWITGCIKMQIKARQKAFSRGDKLKYKQFCEKVANFIATAKTSYYRSNASELRTSNQLKWYKCIYSLLNVENTARTQSLHGPENIDLSELSENLQKAFIKPWSDRYTNVVSEIPEEICPLKNNKPLHPSIGQVKAVLKHLNPRKELASIRFLHGYSNNTTRI